MTNGDMITDNQRIDFLQESKTSLYFWYGEPDYWTVQSTHEWTERHLVTAREAIDDAMRIRKGESDDDGSEASS